jgi:hypothetical protein
MTMIVTRARCDICGSIGWALVYKNCRCLQCVRSAHKAGETAGDVPLADGLDEISDRERRDLALAAVSIALS